MHLISPQHRHRYTPGVVRGGGAQKVLPIEIPALSLDELSKIIGNFGTKALIGEGSYGRVFYGKLSNVTGAAIKKLDTSSSQEPDTDFAAQLSLVSRLISRNMATIKVLDASGPLGLPSLLGGDSELSVATAISALRFSPDGQALKINNYAGEPLLRACGVSVSSNFTQVEGRVLSAPRLKVGNGEDFFPQNGRWNFNNKKLVEPTTIERWAVVNFSARCNIPSLITDLIKCGGLKGINIARPFDVFEESAQHRRAPPLVRVGKMFEFIQSKGLVYKFLTLKMMG